MRGSRTLPFLADSVPTCIESHFPVKHPFSGFSPLDIFAEALNEFKIRPFIQEAINAAIRGVKV